MNLIYLHTCDRPPGPQGSFSVGPGEVSHNKFALNFLSDGVCSLLDTMTRAGLVDHVYAFIDSRFSCGEINLTPDFTLKVLPDINEVEDYITPGDVLWVRGGFRPWIPLIKKISKRRENWILFYRANTDRGRWPWWDIVLDDLRGRPLLKRGRLFYPYIKPVNERLFRAIIPSKKVYDVMIGASHIHKHKGQFRAVEALMRYERKHGERLKAILPGGWLRCGHNMRIHELRDRELVHVDLAGHKDRGCLAKLMNQCEIFVHAGAGGQNDRGVLEALRCGVPIVIKDKRRYAPFIGNNSNYVTVCNSVYVDAWVEAIQAARMKIRSTNANYYRRDLAMWYDKNNGLFEAALPRMEKLFRFLVKNNKKPDRNLLRELS